jgi:hypothetical protein
MSTVGRILRKLVERGAVTPVPILRRRPGGRRLKITQPARYARRLAKDRKARTPGELVQIDRLFVNLRPDKPIKHFTAYDRVAKWTFGHVACPASAHAARTLLEKVVATAPFPVKGVQVDGGSEFMDEFEDESRARGLEVVVLPPERPTSTDGSNAPCQPGDTSSTSPTICQAALTNSKPTSTPSPSLQPRQTHQALGDRTSAEYLAHISEAATPSHHLKPERALYRPTRCDYVLRGELPCSFEIPG